MKYTEPKNISYAGVAKDVLHFWNENKIFEASVQNREGKPTFTFYEGPPSANGKPGIHHVMARTIKDIFCRYQTLKGFQVKRKGGWDTHGLPIELQVEKELGITKEDIGKTISIEDYNQKCREAVMRYKELWDDITTKMGYWVDLGNPYITFDKNYMETLWYLLKQFHEKGLLYKGYSIQPYSPAAGTGLSSHEINQPGCYREVKDLSMIAQFKIKGTANDFLLAWTTTPWTLPSNSALAVGKNIEYVKVETHNQYTKHPINVYVAKSLLKTVFDEKKYIDHAIFDEVKHAGKHPYTILEQCKGERLEGLEYEQLMPYVKPDETNGKAFRVILGDFVTTEDGTGIVHISPTFGADDARVAKQNNIPAILVADENGNPMPLVDKRGRFVKEVTDFAGEAVKAEYEPDEVTSVKGYESVDLRIAVKLKTTNRAFKTEKYEHNYPHCWRTDKPILYYPLDSWFIKTTDYKEKMVELNKTINWKPASTGEGRFGNWLENLVDWNLSRSRYWGTPLPIWRSEDGTEETCIGSIADLIAGIQEANDSKILSTEEVKKNRGFLEKFMANKADLHRPYVDDITLVKGKTKLTRELDLIDVWFDSGAMPYAQWHYPFEQEDTLKESYPADFIAEGVDQTRGWFFTLHAISTMLFDSVAYKNVISNGLVLDKKGNKMSKSKGNTVDPFETLDKFGADPTRWYLIENSNPWDSLKFNEDGVTEVQRKFFNTLQNTYSFFALYANLDDFDFDENNLIPIEKRPESDRWVISKLHSLIAEVDIDFAEYEPTKAARAMSKFVTSDLSNWYVRLNRKRFWKAELVEDKIAAYQTLYTCLETIALLASPIAPFYSDFIYRNLKKVDEAAENAEIGNENTISVHLADFPISDSKLINKALEAQMELAQQISSMTHALRKKNQMRVRQPLQKIMVAVVDETTQNHIKAVQELILSEVNVKELEFLAPNSDKLTKTIKPNFKKLGGQYGKAMPKIAGLVKKMTQADIATLEQTGIFTLNLDGETIPLTPDDVEIGTEDIAGWVVMSENGITVALDVNLTDELRQEGVARDLVNRIQNLRKDEGLEVQDKILLQIEKGTDLLNAALANFKDYICDETQALEMDILDKVNNSVELETEETKVNLSMKVSKK
ncbi:Isoleucyl-tRNA synthetase [Bernardetia litoralis DSM 6794]|uniref:Isoleucine--tRNA ligase n=1 Tax=Bernardetia litoralis (strain ATCC 23117 / DSM 6794 / NBRC 15988 / NCIMB 1366 / Fx l1 / Sio-4) TaxID=880071 RepID=I4AJX8_BERLS|nr:isoleucine--tRNA ligase [Bernardetia litoralis]AFM04263.1 Isoleucyl-tRNA synthetase [Bernardetia litoralis DSM 6794]